MTIRALRAFATLHVEKRRQPSERLIVWMWAMSVAAICVAIFAAFFAIAGLV